MSSPQREICDKCGLEFYSVLGEQICPECEKKGLSKPTTADGVEGMKRGVK